jgi:hypothetical protein
MNKFLELYLSHIETDLINTNHSVVPLHIKQICKIPVCNTDLIIYKTFGKNNYSIKIVCKFKNNLNYNIQRDKCCDQIYKYSEVFPISKLKENILLMWLDFKQSLNKFCYDHITDELKIDNDTTYPEFYLLEDLDNTTGIDNNLQFSYKKCSVCYEYTPLFTNCNHHICRVCINEIHRSNNNECPICRCEFSPYTHTINYNDECISYDMDSINSHTTSHINPDFIE